MSKRQLIIFDVCDTLYYSNTTFDFLNFFAKKQNINTVLLRQIQSKKSPINWVAFLLTKIFKHDFYRIWATKTLKNYSSQIIQQQAQLFVETYLCDKKIEPIFTILNEKRNLGAKIVLASSSLSPVVEAIANKLDVDFFASELAFSADDKCNGKLKMEVTGQKLLFFDKIIKTDFESVTVVTDNFSDYTLAKWADKCYIVVYNENDKMFWQNLNPEFIVLKRNKND